MTKETQHSPRGWPNPIYFKDQKWWHADETWSNEHGPFETKHKAKEAHNKYYEYLNASKSVDMAPSPNDIAIPITEKSI